MDNDSEIDMWDVVVGMSKNRRGSASTSSYSTNLLQSLCRTYIDGRISDSRQLYFNAVLLVLYSMPY